MKKTLLTVFIFFVIGLMNASALQITSRLQQKRNSLNPLQYTRVLILLSDKVDIDRLDADLYRMNASLEYRAYTVITQLQQKAAATQGPLLSFLNAEKSSGKVKDIKNFWITNLIMAEVTSEVLNQLTYRNDIEVLDLDDECMLDKPVSILPDNKTNNSIETVETGLKVIRADSLWRLGITGAGSTVMNIDNGVNGSHPALGPKWWGNNGRPWYWSWFNVRTPSVTFPNACAGDFHGSHTMGIMCGSNSATGDTVGVAPGARWIAAAVTDCPGAVYPSDNVTAFQWGVNPDSNASTITDMPTVISCSWQDPNASDQCTTSIYRTLLASVEAAGVAIIFSAGNSGPGASTCTPPKNINIDSINVMCVGAVDANVAGYPIASFSSRGPSLCGGTGTLLIKPEVSAPGNNVRSSYSGTSYSLLSGTSMASPHVAGCIALLKQAAPSLTGKQLKAILFSTCTDLGAAGEDNDYGKGLVNVMAAYRRLSNPPLSAFNLLTPPAGNRIVTIPGDNTPVTITWDTSATGANYKFAFGNPTVSTRRFTISSSVNSITTTLGALDAILASSGFTNNGTASDSAVGQWTIWAYKGSNAPGPDSLSAANGPRAITFRRQQITISSFALVAPASGTSITTSPIDPTTITFSWRKSGSGGSTYRGLFKTGASYSDPATLRLLSGNSGLDTSLTLRYSQLDSILAGLGLAAGDSVMGYWRARAYTSSDSVNSTAPDRLLTLRRASLLPLFQNFADASMPPAFWTLSIGSAATQYWTREAPGAFGGPVGSAKYNFYNAQASTGPQTLTSNQFPPVTAGLNYLRFNYAGAYYSATAIDSMVIETSINAGANWTRLIGMYQSTSLSSGTNSSAIMSTVVLSNAVFTPTATQWATKIYSMPVGTNMVRFVAKSAYGNNLFIDDITSGGPTGTGDPVSFTPVKYELFQNFPNPFNPTTKINFSLPKQGLVTLKIYDMLGKEIAQLVNEIRVAGNYSVDFNASNLASGVYFYRIESADFKDTKRMMLIK